MWFLNRRLSSLLRRIISIRFPSGTYSCSSFALNVASCSSDAVAARRNLSHELASLLNFSSLCSAPSCIASRIWTIAGSYHLSRKSSRSRLSYERRAQNSPRTLDIMERMWSWGFDPWEEEDEGGGSLKHCTVSSVAESDFLSDGGLISPNGGAIPSALDLSGGPASSAAISIFVSDGCFAPSVSWANRSAPGSSGENL